MNFEWELGWYFIKIVRDSSRLLAAENLTLKWGIVRSE